MSRDGSGGGMLLLGGMIGVLVGVALGMALLSYAYPVFQSDKWAAWVQAFGSIGALGVAVYVPYRLYTKQEKKNESLRVQNETELLRAAIALAREAKRSMSITAEKISKSERPIEKEVLLDVRESFRVLLAKNIPVRTVQSIMTIQREISYQVAAINLHNQRVDCFSTKGRTARKRARKVSYELKKLEETIG